MKKLSRPAVALFTFAGLAGSSSIALGAFAAHGVAKVAPTGDRAVTLFGQATSFQMSHTLALIGATLLSERVGRGLAQTVLRIAALLMALAILLFPGALYSGAFEGPQWFAPYGGMSAMFAWLLFSLGALLTLRGESAGASQGAGAARPHPAE